MARTYKRDSNGRFSSTGGARSGRPAAKPVSRGKNRITRDNAGRITGVGGEGATARGGRLRTAAGNKRAVQTARIRGGRTGTVAKPKGLKPDHWIKKQRVIGKGEVFVGRYRNPDGRKSVTKKATGAKAGKADLSSAGFSRRLSRAKAKLKQAEKNYESRGASIYDKQARNKVMVLRSAVSSLSAASKRVKDSTVPPSQIKARLREGKKDLVDNYKKQIGQIRREAASTAGSRRMSTAPKLTRSEKAAATRRKNADKKLRDNIRRMEEARRR